MFGLGDPRQGIVHVVGPEQGLTLPGLTLACGDSHTSTHGAYGAIAFGIGASEAAVEELLEGGLTDMAFGLQDCRVAAGGRAFPFSADPAWRTKLLHGWDDIGLTLSHLPEIGAYAARDRAARTWAARPWAAPHRAWLPGYAPDPRMDMPRACASKSLVKSHYCVHPKFRA